jgi:putative ABC transport system substrate-binding protein
MTRGDQMNRRDAILAVLAFAIAPLRALSQQVGKIWRIGCLSLQSGPGRAVEVFREQLRSLGYVEGRNLLIEYRWAAGNVERLQEFAVELVRLKVDVIVPSGGLPAVAAKRATSTIPIVMVGVADAVGTGLVARLARPGGNVTGTTSNSTELAGKRVQLVQEILPKATRVATLALKGGLGAPLFLEQVQGAAKKMGITLVVQQLNEAEALPGAFAAMQRERAQALIVQSSPFTNDHRKRILELAAQHRLPAIFEGRVFVDEGGLLSYGPSGIEMSRRAAFYIDRIFKGAKPADLPVEEPTRFEMVINVKTAKALGITIPQSMLVRADEVIE